MISKLMLLELVAIQEKKQLLLNKGIPNEIIDKLLLCDPTNKNKTDADKVGSYTDWIISRYLKDRSFTNFDKLKSLLQLYDRSKHKIPDKQMQNIGLFNTLNELITFVNNNQDKLAIASEEFVVKTETDHDLFYSRDFVIHVPHTKELSINLGSGTKWCSSLVKDNKFNSYYEDGYLFYISNKTKHLERFNLFLDILYDKIEFADDKNKHLAYKLFDIVKQDNTLIPLIRNYIKYKNINLHKLLSEFINCNTVYDIVLWHKHHVNQNADIYFETDDQKIINILSQSTSLYKYIPNPSHLVQLLLIKLDISILNYITNFTKDIQLLLVSHSGYLISDIIKLGIIPDADVQMLLVLQDIDLIKTLLESHIQIDKSVQIYLVTQNAKYILLILKLGIIPDKDVQLLLVNQNGLLIQYIKNPDKDVQILLVSEDGYLIRFIKNPDKDVQLLLVKENGHLVRFIENPNKDIQLLLLKQYPELYSYINNPDPELILLYKQLKGIKESTGYISKLLDVN